MEWDRDAFENAMIEEMRANDGQVKTGPLAGHPLLVMTSTGAKSGEPRRALLTYSRDDGDFVVAGTAGGSPKDPSWLANLRSEPHVAIEAENHQFDATATIIDGPERDRLWDQHVRALPWFAAYPDQTGRTIPMVKLTPSSRG